MAHNKNRSDVNVGNVDWTQPQLNELLQKIDGFSLDHRSETPPRKVKIRIASGWDTGPTDQSAMLVAQIDDVMVLATRLPLPHGAEVQVSGLPDDGPAPCWAVVTEEREGVRTGDKPPLVYLNWLRPR
ncbi:hypothetical protein ACFPPA_06275 [Rhodanobacter ginsengisoli]|uniref:Uncharacterized protein n=1 Tax=Rhodanobacter ginsengisoli TaxID=418646 RepID=A0ABW0QKK4_9GAMM